MQQQEGKRARVWEGREPSRIWGGRAYVPAFKAPIDPPCTAPAAPGGLYVKAPTNCRSLPPLVHLTLLLFAGPVPSQELRQYKVRGE